MKISVIEFKEVAGNRVYRRGVSVVTSVAQFREAVVHAFKELNVNELLLQLGVQDDPATYSKPIQEEIWSAYIDLAVEHAEIVHGRLVRVADPNGQLVMNGLRDVRARNEDR